MANLYLTADKVGLESGGGLVTKHEVQALRSLGDCAVISREQLEKLPRGESVWAWDDTASIVIQSAEASKDVRLCHGYAGTFPDCTKLLKERGVKVAWTVAAHDRFVSRREHEKYGINFAATYPHLCEDELWNRYIAGYRAADVIVCPSTHSKSVVEGYGGCSRVVVVPHGCTLPTTVAPPHAQFIVGYLGSCGAPDKGVRYLLEAWKKLAYTDSLLVLAGHDSCSPHVRQMVSHFGGGNIHLAGWQKNVSDFYGSIGLFVAPSATEGFNIEVIEALAHGRMALVSTGAGAADIVPRHWRFDACNVNDLCGAIDYVKAKRLDQVTADDARRMASKWTWERVRGEYVKLWTEMLCG